MQDRKETNGEKLDKLTEQFQELKTTLFPDMPGIKGVFERIFDKLGELPCQDHSKRIDTIEDRQMVNNAVSKERNKWLSRVFKIGLPVGATGGLISFLRQLLER